MKKKHIKYQFLIFFNNCIRNGLSPRRDETEIKSEVVLAPVSSAPETPESKNTDQSCSNPEADLKPEMRNRSKNDSSKRKIIARKRKEENLNLQKQLQNDSEDEEDPSEKILRRKKIRFAFYRILCQFNLEKVQNFGCTVQ